MSDWAVIRTHPNCDKMAIRNLVNQSFEYYQPKILVRRKKQNKFVLVEQPLFPGYIFVRIAEHWVSLQSTYGVAALICNGARPALLRQQAIDSLRDREVGGIVQLPKRSKFSIKDKVTIIDGPFAGQAGLVARMPTKDRQKVLLDLLSNKISVLVDEELLEAG